MEAISKHRSVRRKHGQVAGRGSNTKEQTEIRTAIPIANGFLSHQFLPLYQPSEQLPAQRKVEKDFFISLSILTRLYGFISMGVSDKPYPYNILLAHWDALHQLNTQNQQVELAVIADEQGKISLATKQTYNTGTTFYYIPVIPLYRLLQDKKQKQSAELLLSVFAYLYHVAGIPHYREDYSALFYYYEMIKEWLMMDLDSYEEQDINNNISELNAAEYYGDVMLRKMYNRYHLTHFKQRMDSFKGTNDFQKECLRIARTAYELFSQYPDRSVFHHTHRNEQDCEDGVIRAEQYISFIADNQGWLCENVEQTINTEFNECRDMEEPCVIQSFNNPNATLKEGLDFEQQLFPLIDDVCTLLNNLP